MASGRQIMGNQKPGFADQSESDLAPAPGIYLGVVKSIDTSFRTGRLKVFISAFGGDPNNESSLQDVVYASPYMGSTTGPAGSPQYNSYPFTKQTYGFFMTPPDVENTVLCCFPNGRGSEGYWFACVDNSLSKNMVPANGAVSWNDIDTASLSAAETASLLPYLQEGGYYPVGEFNENDNRVFNKNWTKNKRPINPTLTWQYIQTGLDTDLARGPITSSMQRDPISTVLGFNSPGRPFPGQDPKNVTDLRQKLATGNFNSNDYKVTGRLPGHSFVMDDGDIYGQSQLTRWRSASGHQIIMNDNEGCVYISNSAGSAWVELNNQGGVFIYSQKDLAVRTQGNLQLHSDKNININAEGSINMRGLDVNLEAPRQIQASAGQILNLYGKQGQIKSGGTMAVISQGPMAIKGSALALTGKPINLNGGEGGGEVAPPRPLPQYLTADTLPSGAGWTIRTNTIQGVCYIVPTHEPYIRNKSPQAVAEQQAAAANAVPSISNTTTTINGETVTPPIISPSSNIDQAKEQTIQNPAPVSAFISQPDPGVGVGTLTTEQYQAYMAQTGYRQSVGSYTPDYPDSTVPGVSANGFVGKYSLPAQSLVDLGYVKPDTPQTAEGLNNPSNWIGGAGNPSNLQEFLNTPSAQDKAMTQYTQNNYAELQKQGVIKATTSTQDIAGYLSVSHNLGASTTSIWYQGGVNTTDQLGQTANELYNQGRFSQTQVPIIIDSKSSKTKVGA